MVVVLLVRGKARRQLITSTNKNIFKIHDTSEEMGNLNRTIHLNRTPRLD